MTNADVFKAGIPFSWYAIVMQPFNTFWQLLKTVARSTADCYILPGTSTGSEICWLYCMQWKKEISTFLLALISILFAQFDLPTDNRMFTNHSVTEQENIQ